MTAVLFCPVCDESFADEDYCPQHGVRLVPRRDEAATQSVAPVPEPEPSNSKTRDERREDFVARISKGMRKANPDRQPPANRATRDEMTLPPDVADRGWAISGPVRSDEGVDHWPVERDLLRGRENGQYTVYRTGALTNPDTYAALEAKAAPGLVRVEQHGTTEFLGARADYDLAIVPTAPTLAEQLASTPVVEERALWVLRRLSAMLERLERAGFRPIIFEPAQLYYLNNDALTLGCAGAISRTTEGAAFNPSYARSALLSREYAAPELTQDSMLYDNSIVFSVGQILALATWGRPCSLSELLDSAVPFHRVKDEALAQALRGCLWPKADGGRWSLSTLFEFVNGGMRKPMPEVSPWASLQPGASSTAITFAGTIYWRLSELLRDANKPANWREATHNIAAILEWAEDTNWGSRAKLLRKELATGRSADWVLVALSRAVIPDTPPTWRELDLSDQTASQSLIAFAQRALNGGDERAAALKEFFEADLRGAFSNSKSTS